ncbi:Vgb family protein [Paracoccus aerodenitrificans]|uniref:Vgb family protein n=1 Tax=Paracoccus aerodenitrificans TaxID=3017781 RepID=UPI0022F10F87|nr:ATP-binding protein [Paracoccus aerodenitrificans]WBU63024.1 ATP-binding protein [Paracoccus aerodenitrificans]
MNIHTARLRYLAGATALTLSLGATPLLAQTIFTPSSDEFTGRVSAGAAGDASALYPGNPAVIEGEGLVPGQQITLMRGTNVLNADGPISVDPQGNFSLELQVDEEAATGLQPIVVIAEDPAAATVVNMKVSPEIAISGAENFEIATAEVARGLYQVDYSEAENAVFVTSAVGRPPVSDSMISKLDADTLEIIAQVTPDAAPARQDGSDGGVFAVYGVGVDDKNGNIWVSNTRQNTIAVYKASDLSLVKQFEPGLVEHSRDAVFDEANNRAYVSATFTNEIKVYNSETLEELDPIVIEPVGRGAEFSVMSLDIDAEGGKLVTVSLASPQAAVVDLASGEVKVFPLPGAGSASGAAYDPQDNLLFVASQQTDNLLILNAETGEVLHDVEVGAGALNVAFEPESRLAFVSNRGSGTITVVNTDGEVVANLEGGYQPNQLRADGRGNVYAVNKSNGEDGPGSIMRINPN